MRIVSNLISPVRMVFLIGALLLLPGPQPTSAATVYKGKVSPHWFAGADGTTNQFWYRVDLPGGKTEFVTVNAETGARQTASHRDSAGDESLPLLRAPHPSRESAVDTEVAFENRLGGTVNIFWIDPDGRRIAYGSLRAGEKRTQHTYAGHVWLVTAKGNNNLAVFAAEESPGIAIIDGRKPDGSRPRRQRNGDLRQSAAGTHSPDGRWEVVLHRDNLFLREPATGVETQLTTDATARDTFARDLENPQPEVFWSPDSKHFAALRLKPGAQRRVYLVESSPADQLQPKLDSYSYLKPGDEVDIRKPHLFDVEAKKEIPVSDALFANPWSLDDVRWDADSARFTFLFNQRGHQALRIVAVDAHSGATSPLVNETNQTFIDYSGKFFCERLADTEIIWMSERDGWNHLYLYDAKTGAVKNQITKGEWVVRRVDLVDRKKRQIWFQAGGIVPGQDPYYLHFCRVNFDGTGLTVLTEGNGTHSAEFSPDRKFLIDTWSRVDSPPVTELRRGDNGKLICKLETAEVEGRLPLPVPFAAKGRDGITDIYGAIWLPRDFDPLKKYPVVENIYAGPHDSFTPKAFRTSYQQQKLADLGFVVVQLDGMGTANRSKAFHNVCWKNLRDGGFPDRIRWIRAAASKKFPAMDLSRVGIYGTSAGGQDALRALLDHGDFYRAGVADSGCYDNRMDKIWWNEQWMGWPVDDSYARNSCVTDAHNLRSKLLLLAGEMDKNVDPASTMQVVNTLVKADKDFELLIMPGMGHGVLSTGYGWRRLEDFFERNLGGPK